MALPTLVVVSGGPGTGKTTLAHRLAQDLGCPAVVRDEIKQGMVLATPGYRGGGADPLNLPTLGAFFGVLRLLLEAGVTAVAEAAFQDKVWRPNLEPLTALADIRVVRCTVDSEIARERIVQRVEHGHRAAHGDRDLLEAIAAGRHSLDSYVPLRMDLPTLIVDTSDGYRPALADIAAFARRAAPAQELSEG
ncbi:MULTISPECIES: AAA family ATPase [Actinomadura]|uniref:ATP-binding protein n=1 Tax=Actinomadura geliboluensis TaxID=882440 RepID=A0A5S4HGV2_9ACTN|nr:AAA family ATPase [Actinomadura geliboluensis]TMR38200.1 ATP-binding protein [Actinomadura geliboluensis]